MSAIGRVLLGLLTDHLGTKFLALLLSFILLFFVQESLKERRDLRDLTIKFQLSRDLQAEFVIPDDTIKLSDVTIEGLKVTVSEVMSELSRRSREVVLEINRSFLDRYPNRTAIAVDKEFFEAHNIPGEGVRMTQDLPAGLALSVQKLDSYTLTVVLAPGQDDKLLLPAEHPYQGTLDSGRRLDVSFEPRQVTLRCPPVSLLGTEHDKLHVVVPDLAEWLKLNGTGAVPVTSIDWEASGFRRDERSLQFVAVREPRNAQIGTLVSQLRARFPVEERWVPLEVDLDIVELRPVGRDIPPATCRGPEVARIFRPEWLESQTEGGGRARGFQVEVPRTVAADPSRLNGLYLELDWVSALAKVAPDAALIYVPLRLRARADSDPAILNRVRIARAEHSAPNDQPSVRFEFE